MAVQFIDQPTGRVQFIGPDPSLSASPKGSEILPATGREQYKEGYTLGRPLFWQKHAARELGVDEEDVDIRSSGISPGKRIAYSFQPDSSEKFAFLVKRYGADNVKRVSEKTGVSDKGELRDFVFDGGAWKPVDPIGADVGDFTLDLAQYVPQAASEIGVSYATGGSEKMWRIARVVAPNLAGFVAGLTQDMMARDDGLKSGDLIKRGIEAAAGTAIDVPLGYGMRRMAPKIEDEIIEGTRRATKRLSDQGFKVDVQFPGPLGSQEIRLGTGVQQSFRDIQNAITGDVDKIYAPSVDAASMKIIDNASKQTIKMDAAKMKIDATTKKGLGRIAERRIRSLTPSAEASTVYRGMRQRAMIRQAARVNETASAEVFGNLGRQAIQSGQLLPTSTLDQQVKQSVGGSKLPVSVRDNILKFYDDVKRGVLESRGADPAKVKDLTFSDLQAIRSSLRENVDFGIKAEGVGKGNAQRIMRGITGAVSSEMDDMAVRGGFKDQLDSANKFFQERVLPLRQGTLQSLRKGRGEPGYVAHENVSSKLLDGPNPIEDIAQIRRATNVPGQPNRIIKELQQELDSRIIRNARRLDGSVDLSVVKKNIGQMRKDTYEAAYGGIGKERWDRVTRLRNLSDASYAGRQLNPEQLDAYIHAETDDAAKGLLNKIKSEQINRVVDEKAKDAVTQYVTKTGDVSNVDPYTFGESLWKLNKTQAEKLIKTIDDPEALRGIQDGFVRSFFDRSKKLTSAEASDAHVAGNEVLFDPKTAISMLEKRGTRDLMKSVLGEDRVKVLDDIASSYYGAVRGSRKGKDMPLLNVMPYARMGQDGTNGRLLVSLSHLSDMATVKGGNTSEWMSSMWALAVGAENGMIAVAEEMNRDPDFSKSMIDVFKQVPQQAVKTTALPRLGQ